MLLRRILEHFKHQNWVAIWLDLIVVVVGIFLAFQLERWWEQQRLKSDEGRHLETLAVDFREEGQNLDRIIELFDNARSAALTLIQFQESDAEIISVEEFYRLVAMARRTANVEPRRQTYDALVSTGAIEALSDEELKTELGSYFALVERYLSGRDRWDAWIAMAWEPFVSRNLDRSMMLRYAHPHDEELPGPIHDEEQYQEVIGSEALKDALVLRFHFYRDRGASLKTMRERASQIERLITENLERLGFSAGHAETE